MVGLNKRPAVTAAMLTVSLLVSIASSVVIAADVMQYSTINALMQGFYEGDITVAEIEARGNLGIGTFNRLDGEMLMVDGQVYQVAASGAVREMADDVRLPFAMVSRFEADTCESLARGTDLAALENRLDALNPNVFHSIRIDGSFSGMTTRSVPGQTRPYQPLVEVVEEQQRTFDLADVRGSMVGFLSPAYIEGINVPGVHLHFVSDDRQSGGHVLAFTADAAELCLDTHHGIELVLPEAPGFAEVDLLAPGRDDLHRVERQR